MRYGIVITYLSLMTGWIYAVLNMNTAGDVVWWLPFAALLQIAMGFALGRWWAPLLSLAAVLVAAPAGYPEITPSNAEPFPIWFSLAFGQLVGVPLVLVGVTARKISDGHRRRG